MKPLPTDAAFFQSLYEFDSELFLQVKAIGCLRCHWPLDTSNYSRKLRGLGEEQTLRFSLCCRQEGCRKRVTPPSLRFFGRKVYGLWVVILAIDYADQLGLPKKLLRQTLARWRLFWQERLAEASPFMKWARGFLPPGWIVTRTPQSLVSAFKFPDRDSWIPLLKFFTQRS